MIRPATEADAAAIAAIYNPYIADTVISFEEQPVSVEEMAGRIRDILATGYPWLVMELDGGIVGYAYAGGWKTRAAYRYSVECTVYLDRGHTGKGCGKALYTALIGELKTLGIHSAIGGIALPNPASVALHESLGFRKVAEFHEVGYKFDRWIDVGYWELKL